MELLDPASIVFALVVCCVGFVITSAVGIGSALFLVPLLMARLPAPHAIALVAPITLVGNVWRVWLLRNHIDWKAVAIGGLPAVPVVWVAASMTMAVDAAMLKFAVGVMVMASVGIEFAKPDALRMGPWGLGGFCVAAGALSGLSGLAGPPVAIALRAYGLHTQAFVATLSLIGVCYQSVKVPAYIVSGAMPLSLWPLALGLILMSFVGTAVATRLLERMSLAVFRQLLNALLVVVAISLIWQSVAEWA